jgi:hypothetical protein
MADKLPKKHQKTLEAIFTKPTRSDVRFSRVVSLMKRLGADVDEGAEGSSVAFALKGKVFLLHKPHPEPEMSKSSLERLRKKLADCGVKP